MDTELLKTFLEVCHTRHFGRAAENLCLTPSAVSARIKQLEEALGTPLFTRNRNRVEVTGAGERLVGYARSLLGVWEQACQEIMIDASGRPGLVLLTTPGLWGVIPMAWLGRLVAEMPDLRLHVETLGSQQVVSRLQRRGADLGLIMEPMAGAGVRLTELGAIELRMVSSVPGHRLSDAFLGRYIVVDWNASFRARHAAIFREPRQPDLWVSTAAMALDVIREVGGTCYLPQTLIARELASGQLHLVEGAPSIELNVYAVAPEDGANVAAGEVLALIRDCL